MNLKEFEHSMNLKEFEHSCEATFDHAHRAYTAYKTLTHDINLLTCSPEVLERFLYGKTVLEKLLELRETSEFIYNMDSNMDIGYDGSYTRKGYIVFQINESLHYKVTVSYDDFMDFTEIMKDYEVIDKL